MIDTQDFSKYTDEELRNLIGDIRIYLDAKKQLETNKTYDRLEVDKIYRTADDVYIMYYRINSIFRSNNIYDSFVFVECIEYNTVDNNISVYESYKEDIMVLKNAEEVQVDFNKLLDICKQLDEDIEARYAIAIEDFCKETGDEKKQ